ncbi:MAG: DUF4326 domain-containing protein [Propionibacteriaceae bacterium]|nr:DUF4326 domain-containing protein [Propionibacteriaceae bacterium]
MSRQHKWRDKHPDAVNVARPSRHGNPYRVTKEFFGAWSVVDREGFFVHDENQAMQVCIPLRFATKSAASAVAVDRFIAEMADFDKHSIVEYGNYLRPLLGRDLACWCPIWDETTPCPRCHGSGGLVYPPQLQRPGREVATCGACEGTGFTRYPCHGDVLLRLANPDVTFPWAVTP